MLMIVLNNGSFVKVPEGQNPDQLRAECEREAAPQNGVLAIGPGWWEIYVNGSAVGTAYGPYEAAMIEFADWKEALENDPVVENFLDIPFDELPDDYWKNPPETLVKLEDDDPVWWRQENGDTVTEVTMSGEVRYIDK